MKVVHRTSVHTGGFKLDRSPVDARERQESLTLRFKGDLLHESWVPDAGLISHGGAAEAAAMTIEFFGDLVKTPDDAARALRAIAAKLETVG